MEAINKMSLSSRAANKANATPPGGLNLMAEDKMAMGNMKYAMGLGASLRYANELRAVQQVSRLPALKSSHLHEDVLRGRLGPGTGFEDLLRSEE